ncbi:sodium/hydrogen exchanger 3 isoform X2 [Physcomitrium patens]|uniref:Cation/H+ exchanger transmembrane domain-containing protein n=1 Tax=Physcomitrium patens TaxID=3218 RepID=A0A7I4DRG9_PHYPA|nr:sodium/hydrogen exchanger 3-like isoform X2 [Physcomitrium patens]|eukprot:XP_024375203.1 sodium/hydrogen exchanger 3-like isoform X2 [Physcomitrella patens]
MATNDVVSVSHSMLLKATDLKDDRIDVISICLFVFLLCACIVLGHLLEENRWMNESITALLLGLFTGSIVLISSKGQGSHILEFDEELFFIYLLPPIIFNAGFQVKKKEFFRNFITIMFFGVIGVFISFGIISTGSWYFFSKFGLKNLPIRDILAIGVIFSATDSVCTLQVLNQDETPLLYSLVFGEGVVNDATSVVLFRAVQTYNFDNFTSLEGLQIGGSFLYLFFSSCILGIASGLISAYIIKTMYFGRHSTDREIAIMTLMAYLSYVFAELFYLSGILSVFFCGIVMSHYTWHNVTENSRITSKHSFATMSFIAETFIFLYVGMDALDFEKWKMMQSSFTESAGLFGSLLFLVLLGRAAFVFPLSALSNYSTKSPDAKINLRQMVIIWWAGLMRGAVSIALAFNQGGDAKDSNQATLMVITIIIVLFSTIVFGTATKPLISWLLPPHFRSNYSDSASLSPKASLDADFHIPLLMDTEREELEANDRSTINQILNGLPRPQSIGMLLTAPRSTIHHVWRKFDDSYMRPTFGGRGYVRLVSRRDMDIQEDEILEDHS